MNDNPVVLADTHIRLNVSELTTVGTVLTRINATDADIGLNGKVNLISCVEQIHLSLFFLIDSLFD